MKKDVKKLLEKKATKEEIEEVLDDDMFVVESEGSFFVEHKKDLNLEDLKYLKG